MFVYDFNEWLVFFYAYCFFGWCFESTFVSLRTKRFTNRGFMKGPWLPIYGCGAIATLIAANIAGRSCIGIFAVGALLATIIEYITGAAMVKIFKVRYWDYTDRKIQLNGHICLSSTVAWGVLSLIMVFYVQPFMEGLFSHISRNFISIIGFLVTVLMVYDFTNALKEALDIRSVITEIEKAKAEIDEFIDEKKDELEEFRYDFEDFVEEIGDHIENRVKERREKVEAKLELLKERFEAKTEKIARNNPGFKNMGRK